SPGSSGDGAGIGPRPEGADGLGSLEGFLVRENRGGPGGVPEPERPVATFRQEGAPQIVFPRRDRIVEAGQFSVAEIPHARGREKGRRFTDTAVIPLHRTEVD